MIQEATNLVSETSNLVLGTNYPVENSIPHKVLPSLLLPLAALRGMQAGPAASFLTIFEL